jgi:hypothetical protein
LGIADNLIQFLKRFGLFVREQLGIPDDINEQDMRDLEAWLDFLVIRHLRGNVKRTPSTALDDFFTRQIFDGGFRDQVLARWRRCQVASVDSLRRSRTS